MKYYLLNNFHSLKISLIFVICLFEYILIINKILSIGKYRYIWNNKFFISLNSFLLYLKNNNSILNFKKIQLFLFYLSIFENITFYQNKFLKPIPPFLYVKKIIDDNNLSYNKILSMLDNLLNDQKYFAEAYFTKAMILFKLKQYNLAKNEFLKVFQSLPYLYISDFNIRNIYTRTNIQLGFIYLEEKNYRESLKYFDHALIYSSHSTALTFSAYLNLILKNKENFYSVLNLNLNHHFEDPFWH